MQKSRQVCVREWLGLATLLRLVAATQPRSGGRTGIKAAQGELIAAARPAFS